MVYFWGTRYVSPYTRPSTREVFSQSFGSRMATPSDTPLSESDLHTMMHLESMRKEMSSGFHQQLGMVLNKMSALYWHRMYQIQKPKVEMGSLRLIFYNNLNFMKQNSIIIKPQAI